jgi:hypothetical protein
MSVDNDLNVQYYEKIKNHQVNQHTQVTYENRWECGDNGLNLGE